MTSGSEYFLAYKHSYKNARYQAPYARKTLLCSGKGTGRGRLSNGYLKTSVHAEIERHQVLDIRKTPICSGRSIGRVK
jgi:hypothetical protein